MAAKKPLAPPLVLNGRQRHYLLAAYYTDQQAKEERQRDYLRGLHDQRSAVGVALAPIWLLGASRGTTTYALAGATRGHRQHLAGAGPALAAGS